MGALDGIRVIEIANWAAVPSTGVLLAEQGAEVIKVEPPAGDSMRGLMHQVAVADNEIDHAFQFSNRLKKSVAIDLTTTAGHDVGFGESGPDADKPGYDLTSFFARSGLSSSVGGFDGRPPRWRAAQGDHVAGLSLYAAITTALVQRASTGVGVTVETSLLQSAAWSNAYDLTRAATDGRPARAKDRYGTVNVTSEAFLCSDGRYVQLSLAEPVKGWRIMCAVLGLGDIEHDERYVTPVQRFTHMAELIDLFDVEIAKHDSAALVDAITELGGVAAVVLQSHEVVVDPQARAVGILRPVECDGSTFDVVAPPFSLGADHDVAHGFGSVGTDTDAVLADLLNISATGLDDLEAQGAIGRGPQSA